MFIITLIVLSFLLLFLCAYFVEVIMYHVSKKVLNILKHIGTALLGLIIGSYVGNNLPNIIETSSPEENSILLEYLGEKCVDHNQNQNQIINIENNICDMIFSGNTTHKTTYGNINGCCIDDKQENDKILHFSLFYNIVSNNYIITKKVEFYNGLLNYLNLVKNRYKNSIKSTINLYLFKQSYFDSS